MSTAVTSHIPYVAATLRNRERLGQVHGETRCIGTCTAPFGCLQPCVVEYRKYRTPKGRLSTRTIVVDLGPAIPARDVPAFFDALSDADIDAAYAAAGVALA